MKRNWKRILSLWLTVCMVFTMNFGLGATAVYAEEPGADDVNVSIEVLAAQTEIVENATTLDVEEIFSFDGNAGTNYADGFNKNDDLQASYELDGTTFTPGTSNVGSAGEKTLTIKITKKSSKEFNLTGETTKNATIIVKKAGGSGPEFDDYDADSTNVGWKYNKKTGEISIKNKTAKKVDLLIVSGNKISEKELNAVNSASENRKFAANGIDTNADSGETITQTSVEQKGFIYARYSGDNNTFASTWAASGEYTILAKEAPYENAQGGWTLEKPGTGDEFEPITTYDAGVASEDGTTTVTLKQDITKLKVTPVVEGADKLLIKAGEFGSDIYLTAGVGAPEITVENGTAGTVQVYAGDTNTTVLEEVTNSLKKTTISTTEKDDVATSTTKKYFAVKEAETSSEAPGVFEAEDGLNTFRLKDENDKLIVSANETVIDSEAGGVYTLNDSVNGKYVYVLTEDGKISKPYTFTASALKSADQGNAISQLGSATFSNVKKETASVNIADATKIPDDSFMYVSGNEINGAKTKITFKKKENAIETGFTQLDPGKTYNKLYVGQDAVIEDMSVKLGFEISADKEFTTKTDGNFDGVNITSVKPYQIILSADKADTYYAILVSENDLEKATEIAETQFNGVESKGQLDAAGYKLINTGTGTRFDAEREKAYSKNENGDIVAVNVDGGKRYYVFGVSVNGSTIVNDPEHISFDEGDYIETDAGKTFKPSISVKNTTIEYAGADKGVSENIVAKELLAKIASKEAIDGSGIKIVSLNAYKPADGDQKNYDENAAAKDYAADNYNAEGTGWPAGEYVAIAKFVGDDTYYGEDYVQTASVNFVINKKKIYIKPNLGINTVSAGKALNADYPSKFGYVIQDKNKKDVKSSEVKLSDTGYIFTTVSGEVINAETAFPEGSHKIYVSQNDATLVTEGDAESYEVISGYNNKDSLYETITSVKLQTPRIDATGKDLYYYAYTQLVEKSKQGKETNDYTKLHEAMADYVKVTMGSTNITKDSRIQFLYWDSVNQKLTGKDEVPEGLSANDIIFISANYVEHENDETWKTDEYVTLKIKPQPVGIIGTDEEQGNARNAEKRDEKYDLNAAIEVYVVDEDGTLSTNKLVDKYTMLSDISQKAFDIDISGVDNTVAGTYSKLPMTWDSASLNSTKGNDWFTKNYVIDNTNTYVKTYKIKPVVNVRVLDATDGSVISSNVIDDENNLYSYNSTSTKYTFAVSLNKANPAAFNYNGAYDSDKDTSKGTIEIGAEKSKYPYIGVNGSGYVYTFDLEKYFDQYKDNGDADLDLYAYYQDKDSAATNSSGTVTVAAIEPVYYNGYKHVTSATAFKKGQKNDIKLEVKTSNGEPLNQDIDYTVSYKNNTNVGYASDTKAPQVIIKGKGQYKGLKITAKFTILPQKFSDVEATIKSQYVPLTKKGVLKLGETLTLGKKINKSFYTLSYRDLDNNDAVVTQSQLAAAYEGTKALHLKVYATSVNPKGKKVNFSIGDTVWIESIYAYPKGSKALKVKLANKGKIAYSTSKTSMKLSDIIDGKNETVTIGKTTVSKDMLDLDQAEFYKDKNFTKGGYDEVDDAGTYYLMVVPKAEYMAKLGVYKPTAVKVQFTGEKLTKKLISLATKKQAGVGYALKWKLNTSLTEGTDFYAYILDAAGNKRYIDDLKQTSNKDGYTLYAGNVKDKDGTDYIDKGAGTFTIVIEGQHKYSGELKLKYSYGKASVKSLGYKGIQVNGGKAVVYDPSEGAAENGTYQQMTLTILSANDTASKYTGKKADYGTLVKLDEIKSIAITGSKVGKNTGKVTITFKHYTGKLTGKFDIEQVAVDTTNIRKASIYKGEKSAKVFLAQKIDGVDYAFKKGTDFKLSNFSALNDTTGQVTIDITEKGRIKGSSMTGITFPIYSGKVTDVKIAALSENEGVVKAGEKYNTVSAAEVSYNSVGKYYDYKGTSGAVMPKVEKVTCKIDGKETTVPASNYDVTYIPATGLDKDGNTIYVKGTYKVIITFNANSGNTYPSFTSYGFTYKVNEATK